MQGRKGKNWRSETNLTRKMIKKSNNKPFMSWKDVLGVKVTLLSVFLFKKLKNDHRKDS